VIHVAELIGRVSVTRPPPDRLSAAGDAPGPTGFPLEHVERVVPAAPPEATPTIHFAAAPSAPVDPRLIADLVYRLMRDDLAISRERA
jgi:hypothetical protein